MPLWNPIWWLTLEVQSLKTVDFGPTLVNTRWRMTPNFGGITKSISNNLIFKKRNRIERRTTLPFDAASHNGLGRWRRLSGHLHILERFGVYVFFGAMGLVLIGRPLYGSSSVATWFTKSRGPPHARGPGFNSWRRPRQAASQLLQTLQLRVKCQGAVRNTVCDLRIQRGPLPGTGTGAVPVQLAEVGWIFPHFGPRSRTSNHQGSKSNPLVARDDWSWIMSHWASLKG